MQDLMQLKNNRSMLLKKALKVYRERGKRYAIAEKEYRAALSSTILILRSDNMPVTIISDVARGTEKVATLKQARDIAETLYESAKEAIYAYKLDMRLIEAQIQREWGQKP